MLVCVVLISPLLNFTADKVDSLVIPDVHGGPVCCAYSTSSPQQCFYALLKHLGGCFVPMPVCACEGGNREEAVVAGCLHAGNLGQ